MPKKKKGGAFFTREEDFKPFGLNVKAKDLIITPLGLTATVLGVKYQKKDDMDSGVLWVEYKEGFKSPLEKDLKGYTKCSDADNIWRDVADYHKKMAEVDEMHYVVHELNRVYREELIEEENRKKEAAEKAKNRKKKKKPSAEELLAKEAPAGKKP